MNKLITGTDMVKVYGQGKEQQTVLDQVSLHIEGGEFVAIMGPSGSGKSTLLFALSGMDSLDSGSVAFEAMELGGLSADALADLRRTRMGFVFQQPTLLKNLNILDNIMLPAMRDNRSKATQLEQKAKQRMKQTGILELAKRDISQLSGGQLQRAGICRALMADPAIVFGDEPTGALNSKTAQEVMELLLEIHAEGTALLLVTHDAKVAARAQRVLFMCDGRLVSELRLGASAGEGLEKNLHKLAERMKELGI